MVASESAPAAAAVASGANRVIWVSETTSPATGSGVLPPPPVPDGVKDTEDRVSPSLWKPEPVIVSSFPPASGPATGETESTTGTPNW